MLVWIIDEEWSDYDLEKEILTKTFPNIEIKRSTYDYKEDLENFGYKADGILCQVYADIPRNTINRLENCKGIAVYGGGYDRVDIEAAKENKIMVTNVQGYCAEDLADYTIASIYYANKQIEKYAKNVSADIKSGKWGATSVDRLQNRISNQTLLIIGLGTIGLAVANRAKLLGMKVIAYDEFLDEESIKKLGFEKVSWEEGLIQADYVSVNLKGCDENADKIKYDSLKLMKNTAYIINTSRGKVINEEDIIRAVNEKLIAGAILDVIKEEPGKVGDPIFECENILVTPHISYISVESFRALKEFAINNLIDMINGKKPKDMVY